MKRLLLVLSFAATQSYAMLAPRTSISALFARSAQPFKQTATTAIIPRITTTQNNIRSQSTIAKKYSSINPVLYAGAVASVGTVAFTYIFYNQEEILAYTAKNGYPKLANLFIQYSSNKSKEAALHIATKNGHLEMVNLLIKYKVDINAKNKYGQTALHHAASHDRIEIANALIRSGADINSTDVCGQTPLMYGTLCDYTNVPRILIINGANINIANNFNQTALDIATQKGNISIKNLILEIQERNNPNRSKSSPWKNFWNRIQNKTK